VAALLLTLCEALIGAGLVLYRLVAHDKSVERAIAMPAHLIVTFLLLGALTLAAWWAWSTVAALVLLRGHRDVLRTWPLYARALFLLLYDGYLAVALLYVDDYVALVRAYEPGEMRGALALACGPEGGLEPAERAAFAEKGWRAASLGPNVLRFETAGIAGLTLTRALLRPT
jgi:hypothetical protein